MPSSKESFQPRDRTPVSCIAGGFFTIRATREAHITKTWIQQENLPSLFKIQMPIRVILKFFEKHKCSGIAFFLQSSRCVSNEQPCLKKLECMMIFYFYLVCFTFSVSYSVLISFSLCSSISSSLFFFMFFLSLYQVQQKSFCIHIYKYVQCIHFRKLMNLSITKNYDSIIPLV